MQGLVFVSRARESGFGNPSRISQLLVSEVFEASATIDVDCMAARERAATVVPTECRRFRPWFKKVASFRKWDQSHAPGNDDQRPRPP